MTQPPPPWSAPGYPPPPGGGYPAPPPVPPTPPYPGPYGYPPAPGYRPPEPVDPTLAPSWRRLVARIVDGLVTAILVAPLWIWLVVSLVHTARTVGADAPTGGPASGRSLPPELRIIGLILLAAVVQALLVFLYDWLQHARWGQTLGKRVMKIKVVTHPGRTPLAWGTAAKRAAAYAFPPLVPQIGGIYQLINVLWQLWDKPFHQCLHDKFAGTVVVSTDKPVIGPGEASAFPR